MHAKQARIYFGAPRRAAHLVGVHVLEQHRPELRGIQMPVTVHVLFLEKLSLFGRDRARLPARSGG
jgi:hypothetical protein